MSLDKNDKLSFGIFGLGAIVAYILAVAANKKSSALAEEGGSPPPIVPPGMRVIRIQRKVGEGPGGLVEYTEKLKYILPEGEVTPSKIKQLQKTLGHPNPSGYIDAWTQRVFSQIYTTWEIAGGPDKGKTAEGPSLLDMIRPMKAKAPLGKGTYDPYTGSGRSGVMSLGLPAPYAGLGERTAARSGKGVKLPVPEGMKGVITPLVEREIDKIAPDLSEVYGGEYSPLGMGAKADEDLATLVMLKKRGKIALPAGTRESASELPKERAQRMRETTVGYFATLPKDEQAAMIASGLVDKMGTPTERGILEVESVEGVHPLRSGVASVRNAAFQDLVQNLRKKLGLPDTVDPPLTKSELEDPQKKLLADAIADAFAEIKVRKPPKPTPSAVGFSGKSAPYERKK